MRCLGRTETDRKITNEPWSSKQNLAEQRRPLFGVNGVVRPKNKRKMQKGLDRAGTVRDAWLTPLLEKFVLTRSEARELGWRSPEQVFHLPWGSLLGVS